MPFHNPMALGVAGSPMTIMTDGDYTKVCIDGTRIANESIADLRRPVRNTAASLAH